MTTGKALRKTETVATPSLLSPQRAEVEQALETPAGGYVDAKGEFQIGAGHWSPVALSEAAKDEARAELAAITGSLGDAGKERTAQWLTTLGTICATGSMTVNDAQAKLRAYASLLRYPLACFSRESLDRAGRAFKWFPTYAEVAEFLDGEQRRIETRRRRLERLLADREAKKAETEPKPRRWSDLSEDERAAADAKLAQLKAASPASVVRTAAKKMAVPDLTPEEIERNRQRMLAEMAADPDFAEVMGK